MNSCIFILTQNTPERRVYLKSSLYFLFKYFNAEFKYPISIFHEGDYDLDSQREIIMGIRGDLKNLVNFVKLDSTDFGGIPEHINKSRLDACIETKAVPYFRNIGYRNMCRWWCINCWKYATGYDYIMRLDDDAFIEEPIKQDLFKVCSDKGLIYSSNMMHVDCGVCNYGFRDLLLNLFPEDKADFIKGLFISQEIPMRDVKFQGLRRLISINAAGDGRDMPDIGEKLEISMPIIFYNNYFITKVSFWLQPKVQELLNAIDQSGLIYYYRLGDAPIHTAVVSLMAEPSQYERTIFKYSKRLQREVFIADNFEGSANGREVFSYMPTDYATTSCITQK